MKAYRAVMTFNSLNVIYHPFEAENKEAVIAMRPRLCQILEEEELEIARRNGVDPAEVPDARIFVDQVDRNTFEVIKSDVDEFDRPDDLPTGYHSRIFVQKVAELVQGPDDETKTFDDAIATLSDLIAEAKKLCGK